MNKKLSDFVVIHSSQKGLRINADRDAASLGPMMDAPESVPIGCTSNRQDLVERGFDAADEWLTDCLLRGYGHSVRTSNFVRECLR